jgi:hypothetical protein
MQSIGMFRIVSAAVAGAAALAALTGAYPVRARREASIEQREE